MSRIAARLAVRLALPSALATLALFAMPATAVVVEDLHATRVAVPDQSPDQRAKAFRAALAEVVVRLTGDRSAPSDANLAELMRAPQRFVGEFAYVQDPPTPAPGEPPLPVGVVSKTLLTVRFEPLALERALRSAGRTVFGRERPRVLVWLAIDDGPERDLVGAEDAEPLVAAAAARALPLAWPKLDDADRVALALGDLAAPDQEKVRAASARHAHDVVLAGRVARAGRSWTARFLLQVGEESIPIEARGAGFDAVAAAALDRVAAELVARYGVRNDELPAVVQVEVEGVADVAAYARVFAFLQELSPVRKVDLLGADAELLRLRVTYRGDLPTLERIIALDPAFGRSDAAPEAGGLRFRLAPPVSAAVPAPGTPAPSR